MNAPIIPRSIPRMHLDTVEGRHPLTFLGLLPRGSAAHVFEENALDFLAEKRPGLNLFDLARAEHELAELLGRSVGIVLISGLRDWEAEELPRIAEQV